MLRILAALLFFDYGLIVLNNVVFDFVTEQKPGVICCSFIFSILGIGCRRQLFYAMYNTFYMWFNANEFDSFFVLYLHDDSVRGCACVRGDTI